MVSLKYLLAIVVCLATNLVIGQKLPNKQTAGVWAGSDMKIDGKLNEAGSRFQAYNGATETYYTLANDDLNLYFTVQAPGHIVRRILNGGLTLTIKSIDKKAPQSISLTYPVYENKVLIIFSDMVNHDGRGWPPVGKDKDSLVRLNNTQLGKKAKFIKVAGIPSVDTLISVYNEDNIKAAGGFDKDLNYVYELSVPLSYLTALIPANQKFIYQVKINEVAPKGVTYHYDAAGNVVQTRISPEAGSTPGQPATYFMAEYVLAKKP